MIMKYCIISSTNREQSNSLKISQFYKKKLVKKGQNEVKIIDLFDLPKNFLFADTYGNRSEKFTKMLKILKESDKFIFVIPEYNGSFPGTLKLFIDAADRSVFEQKKAALVGHAGGSFGNLRGIEHLVGVLHYLYMTVLSNFIYLPKIDSLLKSGSIENEFLVDLIDKQLDDFIAF